jgi:flavin reductase (DIM6/NTAB) family NADH-FMN oxidoreductase RutF
MGKIKLPSLPLIYPIPAVLIGAIVAGKPNYETLGNCGIMSVEPAVIYISSNKTHYTNKGILENKVFSVNIPSTELMVEVDYCGLVSGSEADKSKIFQTFYGNLDKAPMIQECPINLECQVIKTLDVYEMVVFIGEISAAYANETVLSNGFPDTKLIDPLIYSMDNMYWNIGGIVGNGFNDGKSYKK